MSEAAERITREEYEEQGSVWIPQGSQAHAYHLLIHGGNYNRYRYRRGTEQEAQAAGLVRCHNGCWDAQDHPYWIAGAQW